MDLNAQRWRRWFAAVYLSFGLLYAALIPPGHVPDESLHFVWSYQIATGDLGNADPADPNRGTVPEKIGAISYSFPPQTPNRWERFRELMAKADESTRSRESIQRFYPLPTYLPQALALSLGRLLHLPPIVLFYFGRLAMLVLSSLVFLWILRHQARLEYLWILLLPITVQECVSYSADSVVIPLSMAILAILHSETARTAAIRWFGFALTVWLAFTKVPYALVGLATLAETRDGLRSRARHLGYSAIILGSIAFAFAYDLKLATDQYPAANSNPGYAIDRLAQLALVRNNPFSFALILIRTFAVKLWTWIQMLYWLGTFEVFIPVAFVLLSLASLGFNARRNKSSSRTRMLGVFAIFSIAYAFIALSQYAVWSRVGAPLVEGIQGRYFLPLLPMIFSSLMAAPLEQVRFGKVFRAISILVLAAGVQGMLTKYYGYSALVATLSALAVAFSVGAAAEGFSRARPQSMSQR